MEVIALAGVAAAMLAGVLWAGWGRRRKAKALGDPQLVISTTPYALGEAVPCRVASVVTGPIQVDRVRFQLSCSESVRWKEVERTSGGKNRTVEHTRSVVVWHDEATVAVGRELRAGERFQIEADLKLPEEGGPTFTAPHNQVDWQVKFAVDQAEATLVEGALPLVVEPRRRFVAGPGPAR